MSDSLNKLQIELIDVGIKLWTQTPPLDDDNFAGMIETTINLGVPEKAIAKKFKISVDAVRRWATGTSCPHLLGRSFVVEGCIELLRKHKAGLEKANADL